MPLKEYSAEEIKQIRLSKQMTQKIFAEALGVSVKTVEAWETGTNNPSGSATRLLQLLEENANVLDYFMVE